METYALLMLIGIGAYAIKTRDQRRRIALLASHLRNYEIEKLMEGLTEGYMRALGADVDERREQIWGLMNVKEAALSDQFRRFAAEMSRLDASEMRVSKLAWAIPFADQIFPHAAFDLRKALDIHARGIDDVGHNKDERTPRDKAFTLSAELYLMQHTCHWYCKSKTVASARLLGRHRTSYEQVLASVSPGTRQAYLALVGR